ncbi:unnamed protein product [Lupinus luteus]|uniref:NADH:ubiquinone reductase (non-electrogenic) n=1 Tax=Lupinus luteus TaxID=3873 RepID=A0AAV1W398_LUPLU
MGDVVLRYPQVELYLKKEHLLDLTTLLKDSQGNQRKEIDIEGFKQALSNVDSQVKVLPATAQVAAQQGEYLARCFNRMDKCEDHPEGPRRFRGPGHHQFRPFHVVYLNQTPKGTWLIVMIASNLKAVDKENLDTLQKCTHRYKHFGQFAPLGGEQAAAELPGDWVSMGHSTQWLWYSVYASGGGLVAHGDATPVQSEFGNKIPKKKVVVLGTGWAGTSFLKNLKDPSYEVHVVSPRNYFAFTPLLPSVTCGTVEARSVVEPIRSITRKRGASVQFSEAECYKIDPKTNKVYCRAVQGKKLGSAEEFSIDYDYLVIAMGARSNTFNTPGVQEHAHFLKEVEDALRIRRTVIDLFERASLPSLSVEDKKKLLSFVVVGGGPTGVEFAAELHDFVHEDLSKLYPSIEKYAKITLLEAGDHILNMFDKRITDFAESKFFRDGIDVKLGSMVVNVSENEISAKERATGKVVSLPHGMVVWSTGIGTRPEILDFMKQIGQINRRALVTDEWLRLEGFENIYALGDCATVNQRRVMEDIAAIFSKADKDNNGRLDLKEFREVVGDIIERYPQVEIYLKKNQMKDVADLLQKPEESSLTADIEYFKDALSKVDSQMKNLPATAQVAAQQGAYLADCFNRMELCEQYPEGPIRFRGVGRHRFRPFRYKHLGQFAPLGGEQTAAMLPGDWISIGHSSQWLWYSIYASKQVSWRTRMLVVTDWSRRFIFGRDSSRI